MERIMTASNADQSTPVSCHTAGVTATPARPSTATASASSALIPGAWSYVANATLGIALPPDAADAS